MTHTDTGILDRSTVRRVAAACGLGTLIEYFDYASYAYLATTLAVVFFPSDDPTAGLLSTFAVFAIGFVCRPIGALVWGRLGDRVGRRTVLATTIVIMSSSTVAIGLIPSHAMIGVAAPALLLILRMVQSFSAAGEYAGAAVTVAEYAPAGKRGRYISFMPMCSAAGFLTASLVTTVLYHLLSDEAMLSWGWRVPFLVAGPMGIIAMYMRFRLEETPHFKEQAEKEPVEPSPILTNLREHRRKLIVVLMVGSLDAAGYYVLLSYSPTYLVEETGMSQADATSAITIANAIFLLFVLASGTLSDRFGRRPMIIGGGLLILLLSYPLFTLLSWGGFLMAAIILTLFLGIFSMVSGVFSILFTESFDTNMRYTGSALTFNCGAVLFGGLAPYIATWLIDRTGDSRAPAYYLMAIAVISIIATVMVRETAWRPLGGSSDAIEPADHPNPHHSPTESRSATIEFETATGYVESTAVRKES